MTAEEERRALREKMEELGRVSAQAEERLAKLPFSRETEQLRATMNQLMDEMRRMEKNIQAMLQIGEETGTESEGGTENGSH